MGKTPTLITSACVPLIAVGLQAASESCWCLPEAPRRGDEMSPVELRAAVA